MIVFNDVITGAQIMSDSYKQEPLMFNGVKIEGLFLVRSRWSTKSGVVIEGENPSAEAEAAADDGEEKVNNIIDKECGFGYKTGPDMGGFTLQQFMKVYKDWCKAVKGKLVEKDIRPKPFMRSAKAAVPFLKRQRKNMEIFYNKDKNTASFILGWWDDVANANGCQTFIYFKHATIEEKY